MEKALSNVKSELSIEYLLRHDFLSCLASCCWHRSRRTDGRRTFGICVASFTVPPKRPQAHEMDGHELMAYAILLSYFLLIFLSFGLVFRSLVAGIQLDKLFNGRPFFFLRSSIGALLCTWYCELYANRFSTDFLCPVMIQFMNVRNTQTPNPRLTTDHVASGHTMILQHIIHQAVSVNG